MNTNNNLRFRSTEENIQQALFRLLRFNKYESITIKQLCYEAGINRSSFYSHYFDINDLMIKTEERLSKSIVKIFDPNKIWKEDVFVNLFEFLKDNKDFYFAYFNGNNESFMEKTDFMNFVKTVNTVNLCDKFEQRERIYHMAFFGGGLKAISKQWILSDCKESPEQMAKIITNEYKINANMF